MNTDQVIQVAVTMGLFALGWWVNRLMLSIDNLKRKVDSQEVRIAVAESKTETIERKLENIETKIDRIFDLLSNKEE